MVNWSHGKQLWELSKNKYDPLWLKGGHHCDLELFPDYIRQLKRFVANVEKRPHTPRRHIGSGVAELPRHSVDLCEGSRRSMDRRERPRPSVDGGERARKKAEKQEKARRSVDHRFSRIRAAG